MTTLATHAIVHLLRFDTARSPGEIEPQPGPERALGWFLGTDSGLDPELGVLAPGPATVWGALCLYGSFEDAARNFEHPERGLPLGEEASEAWHALLLPTKHWGASDWLGADRIGPVYRPSSDRPTQGPLVVTTAAGYTYDESFDLERAKDFSARVVALREQMPGTEGMILEQNISNLDGVREGMTISVWRDEASMRAFAYGKGPHRAQLDSHREKPVFDRSSFTRYGIVCARGTWHGVDPAGLLDA